MNYLKLKQKIYEAIERNPLDRSAYEEMFREEFPGINVAGEYTKTPSSFPHVSITQSDNSTIADKQDTSGKEAMSLVMFEINVYSNKSEGKKTECKSIAKAIDEKMFSMNFRRLAFTPVPNLEDATIYRIIARYSAATDGENFYRR